MSISREKGLMYRNENIPGLACRDSNKFRRKVGTNTTIFTARRQQFTSTPLGEPEIPLSVLHLTTLSNINLLAPEIFFLILAHPVYKM
jgi:hypothetical protein